MNNKLKLRSILVALATVCAFAFNAIAQEVDPHAAHNHGPAEHDLSAEASAKVDAHEAEAVDPHAGHDHAAESETEVDDPHAGHDHSAEAEAEGAALIELDDAARERYGIVVETAKTGRVSIGRVFPGEIRINDDRMAHIVPPAPGIVREVFCSVGDTIEAGHTMAWIESAELGEAKVDYLSKWTELGCCEVELTRAQEIHANTSAFLTFLESNPSMVDLRQTNGHAMGEHRSTLVTAYAELVYAREAFEREKGLFEKKIGSEEEFLAAESAYKKADAQYAATKDTIAYTIGRDLLEATSTRRVQEIQILGAERKLRLLGLTREGVDRLPEIATGDESSDEPETQCDCPPGESCTCGHGEEADAHGDEAGEECDCPPGEPCAHDHDSRTAHNVDLSAEASAKVDATARLGWYPLRAPFGGVIIEKHLTRGEKVGDDTEAFTVADMRSVWVDLRVYQRDLPIVKRGQSASIHMKQNGHDATGRILFVSPIVDPATRTALARITLDNKDGDWRPGLFVEASITVGGASAAVVVPRSAVQTIEGESIVFTEDADGIEMALVTLGRGEGDRVEILSGLKPGQRYVTQGAFDLKAQIVTSGLDPHAGHGH